MTKRTKTLIRSHHILTTRPHFRVTCGAKSAGRYINRAGTKISLEPE
jgi:hypothetical protein